MSVVGQRMHYHETHELCINAGGQQNQLILS